MRRRRALTKNLGAFLASAIVASLFPFAGQLCAQQLPDNLPFYLSTTHIHNQSEARGQGCIVASGGVAVVPVSVLDGAGSAFATLPGGKRIEINKVEAVDTGTALARIRLGRHAPKPPGKLPVTALPSRDQRVTVVTVERGGHTVQTRCTVLEIRQDPNLPDFYYLETSLPLPPAGGAVYGEGGELLALVVHKGSNTNAGIVVSTRVVTRVARMKSGKRRLAQWSSDRTSKWAHGPVVRYLEARIEAWSENHVRSSQLLEPVIGSSGELGGAISALLGECYLSMGLLPEAIVALRSAIGRGTMTCRIYQQLAWAYLETGQYNEARKFSEKVIGEQDDSAVGYLLLARLNNLQGHYDKAIYESRRALKRFPDCQCAHYERGIAYLSQGRYQAAVKSLKQALELNPSDGETLYGLGYAYLRSGSPAEAVAFLKAAGELRPELTEVWKALGEACSRTNRKDEALEAYRQAICADPGNQNSYYRLAAELMRQGSHDEAINILGQGLESCGPSAWLTYHLGKAYCWAGQLDEARQQAKKLSRQNPSLAKLLANYIEASNGS